MEISELYDEIDAQRIDEFIQSNQEENVHLDFKTVSDADLSRRDDRKSFAVALSGFANSDGGLIVWGVDARKTDVDGQQVDCARAKQEISPLRQFVTRLNALTGECVSPIVEGVDHKAVPVSDDSGFAVTLVPPSDSGPHMAKAGEDRYYKRCGDSFYRMEHFDIEDMFGRRRKPKLSLYTDMRCTGAKRGITVQYTLFVVIGLENYGRGTARYPYLKLKTSPYSVHSYGLDIAGTTGLPWLKTGSPHPWNLFGGDADVVIHPGQVLRVTRVRLEITEGETIKDLVIEAEIAAEDMKPVAETKVVSVSMIERSIRERSADV